MGSPVIIRHYATISPILRIMVVDGIMVFPFGFRKLLNLRLKSMEIGYNLPKSFMKRIGLNSARIFVNGSNLFTFCNKALKDADPEREERDWGANLAYPLMRTYNFGLNINF